MTTCHFRQIRYERDDEPVFGTLEFSLQPGHMLVVEGPNGSGKTTLLRVVAGFLDMAEGHVEVEGRTLPVRDFHETLPLAYAGHKPGFKDDLTVLENLRFLVALHEGDTRRIGAVLQRVGLWGWEDNLGRALSAGQRKRLALAAMLLHPAKLWLMDEPFANLDGQGIALVNALMREHLQQDGMLMTTSHGTFPLEHAHMDILRLDGGKGDRA